MGDGPPHGFQLLLLMRGPYAPNMGAVSVNLTEAAHDIYVVWRDERLASRLVSKAIEKSGQYIKHGDRRLMGDDWYTWVDEMGWVMIE